MSTLTNLSGLQSMYSMAIAPKVDDLHTLSRKYINDPSEKNYASMQESADAVVKKSTKSRIVITTPDGTVVYDSSKGTSNTHENASNKKINENHNSRISIITACLNNTGVGMERKKSTSTGNFEEYLAVRIGKSSLQASGVVRYSLPSTPPTD